MHTASLALNGAIGLPKIGLSNHVDALTGLLLLTDPNV